MSFTSTPLGQQRRLDHQTFLGKQPIQQRVSPRKNSEPDFTQDNALARFARIKEQQQLEQKSQPQPPLSQRGRGPQTITSPPHSPEKWAQKDTSVIIASAFHQAVEESASTSQNAMSVPRSTSVEYENQTHSTTARRFGPAPPSSRSRAANPTVLPRRPLGTDRPAGNASSRPSNGEASMHFEPSDVRGASPFDIALNTARQSLDQVSYFVRQRSTDANTSNSYEYSREEREVQERTAAERAAAPRISASHKKNKMSLDNKAYKPSVSDEEDDDEDYISDDGKRKRRKKKGKEAHGGPLTSLPQISADKRKKKVARRRKDGFAVVDDTEDDDGVGGSGSESQSRPRYGSLPPPDPLDDVPPSGDSGMEPSTLHSIPEVPENQLPKATSPPPAPVPRRARSRSGSRTRTREKAPFSIGVWLGTMIRPGIALLTLTIRLLSAVMNLLGRLSGMIFGILLARPYTWMRRSKIPFGTIFVSTIAFAFLAFLAQSTPSVLIPSIPSLPTIDWTAFIPTSSGPRFEGVAPETVNELLARLQKLEKATHLVPDAPTDLTSRLGALEFKVKREVDRALKAEEQAGYDLKNGLSTIRSELDTILRNQNHVPPPPPIISEVLTPEEKAQMKKLEEKLVDVEATLAKVLANEAKAQGSWWNKMSAGKSSDLKIKAADGTDVSKLIERLVQDAVTSDNGFHQADYASFSSGARIIPSLTSDTLTISPPTLPLKVLGFFTGSGSATALPPVTAIHYDVQNGRCWAMPGQKGQLGIALASGALKPSGFVVEHVRAELATDKDVDGVTRKSAPKEMEVWGLVEGKENIKRVNEWRKDSSASKEMAMIDPPPPPGLSRGFMRLANFTYDLSEGAPSAQFFSIDDHVTMLGLDFGVVVFRILGNHGRKDWTCLYRVRVFGNVAGVSS